MEADIDDHELKSRGGDHLRAHHRLFDRSRADPQQAAEVDAARRGELGIEVIAEVDEGRGFAHGRGRGEGGKDDRVAPRGATGDELDELAALQTAAEKG